MSRTDVITLLREHGIRPSPQRVAVADFVLRTDVHPSADQVWTAVRRRFPLLSRATTYNTLNLFVRKGLLRALVLTEGKVVFDPNVSRHHHFIDERTGRIYDVPWESVEVRQRQPLPELEIRELQVVMRGERRRGARA